MRVQLVSEQSLATVATPALARGAVREAFIAHALKTGELFPVAQGRGPEAGSSFSLKSGLAAGAGLIGFKYGSYWPGNPARGLHSHSAMTVLVDAESGEPKALLNATTLNAFRTAAADAVAVEALSRPDSETLAVLGGGRQAAFEARAVVQVRPIRRLLLWARRAEQSQLLARQLDDLGLEITVIEAPDQARSADIIVCATSAREPLLTQPLPAGVHVSAMGADQVGKQEIAAQLLSGAQLFADDPRQSVTIGEFQHASAAGLIQETGITPIGLVLAGRAAGRRDAEAITIFDSSGLALQDLFVAEAALAALGEATTWVEI